MLSSSLPVFPYRLEWKPAGLSFSSQYNQEKVTWND
jgi:hypothetical protein